MKSLIRSSSVTSLPATLAIAACCLTAAAGKLHAQAQDYFELNDGRRFPATAVKPAGDGSFNASVEVGATIQTVRFTAKEVRRASLDEPKELAEARNLLANNKPERAIEILDQIENTLSAYQGIPDSWWVRAALLRMDALATMSRTRQAASIAGNDVLPKVHPDGAALLRDFQEVITPPGKDPAAKIKTLQALCDRTLDSWTAARIWLEIGNTQQGQGKVEDAVKAWLRVPVFFPAERDLALRGTVLAARGLQQLSRPQDGEKILADYLADHPDTPFKETIEVEIAKLKPKPKSAANGTPAPPTPAPAQPAQPEQPKPAEPAPADNPQ